MLPNKVVKNFFFKSMHSGAFAALPLRVKIQCACANAQGAHVRRT